MDLVNPFEPVAKRGIESPPVTRLRALVPTGAHVSHANDLHHTRNRGGGGGKATKLETYRPRVKGLRQGPFSKGSVQQGLAQVAALPKVSKVPSEGRTPFRVRLARAKQAGVGTQSASSGGRRIT